MPSSTAASARSRSSGWISDSIGLERTVERPRFETEQRFELRIPVDRVVREVPPPRAHLARVESQTEALRVGRLRPRLRELRDRAPHERGSTRSRRSRRARRSRCGSHGLLRRRLPFMAPSTITSATENAPRAATCRVSRAERRDHRTDDQRAGEDRVALRHDVGDRHDRNRDQPRENPAAGARRRRLHHSGTLTVRCCKRVRLNHPHHRYGFSVSAVSLPAEASAAGAARRFVRRRAVARRPARRGGERRRASRV